MLGSSLAWLGSDFGGVLAKWSPHLFISTNGTLWDPQKFPTILKLSRRLYTKVMYKYLQDMFGSF